MTDGLTSWQPRNTASNTQQGATRSASCYPNSMMRPWSPYRQRITPLTNLTDHHEVGIERQLKLNTSPHHLAIEAKRQRPQDTLTTYDKTWTIESVRPDQSTDQGGMLQHARMAIRLGVTDTTSHGPKTTYGLGPNYAAMSPGTEAPHTSYASPTK